MFVTRKTLSRLENRDPSVGLSVVVAALQVLGLEGNILKLADPNTDKVGNIIIHEKFAKPKRVKLISWFSAAFFLLFTKTFSLMLEEE